MNGNNQHPRKKVVAYARKSSEDNEKGEANKQQNSFDYQEYFIHEALQRHGLELAQPIYKDDKTGYEAFQRESFENMLDFLTSNKGDIDGIVCTEISRLARNFGDGGLILWYLQSGVIQNIYTNTKIFTNSSADQLMVAIEFAMSKKSSDDTGERTRLGMRSKVRLMKHPARRAILGYKTEGKVGIKKWVIDPVTGPLVQKVFERFATGNYTLSEIADFAWEEGLKSKDSKSIKNIYSPNTWRNRLKDLQYTGIFYHEDEKIAGEYDPLINSELFYTVQDLFDKKEHPKSTHMDYAYSRIITCDRCGGLLSGTHKKGITYYRCGKRKEPCKSIKRHPYIPETKLENELMTAFEHIEIDEKTWNEARTYVNELNQPEKTEVSKRIRILKEQIATEEEIQLDIGRKFAKNEFSQPEYAKLIEDSRSKTSSLKRRMVKCENLLHELNELMDSFLDNIKYINKRLRHASPLNKREMVTIFCENFRIEGEKLRWDWKKPYFILAKRSKNSTMLPD